LALKYQNALLMKYFLLPVLAFFILLLEIQKRPSRNTGMFDVTTIKKNSLSCSPDRRSVQLFVDGLDIPLMPGAGKYQWNIQLKNDSARIYFNQGINMYYGFHIIESLASFKKAASFEATNPMLWWAQALSYGPNINDAEYTVLPEALNAVEKAVSLSQHATPLQQLLIAAMAVRYSIDTTLTRQALNLRYTMALEKIHKKFPADADVAALYTDAMMLEHPWELWNNNGTPKPWTPKIRQVLENTLAISPGHPGINHYYVHVMEPSPFPEKALASANRLGTLNPGLAHMVHMPSHIYLRTGYYSKGYTVNEEAVKQYRTYLSLYPGVAAYESLYRLHNEHMRINCGMLAGRKEYTINAAFALQNSIDTSNLSFAGGMGNYMQYVYMVPVLAMIRFEDWDGLRKIPAPAENHIYASLLWHFGRGMAYCNQDNIAEASKELGVIEQLSTNPTLAQPYVPFSPAIDGAMIASYLLRGAIALHEKQESPAIRNFELAVAKENAMVYNEPRDWLLNPKNFLANAYGSTGNWAAAEKVYRMDLKDNNENVWSLAGLYKSLLKQRKKNELNKVRLRLTRAAAVSDMKFMAD
jgi:tetratricopeptide (TPR) repeat protein